MKKISVGVTLPFTEDPPTNSRIKSVLHVAYEDACRGGDVLSELFKCFYTRLAVIQMLSAYPNIRCGIIDKDTGGLREDGRTETIENYLKGGITRGTEGKASIIIRDGTKKEITKEDGTKVTIGVPIRPAPSSTNLPGDYFLGAGTWFKIFKLTTEEQKRVYEFFVSCIGNGDRNLFGKIGLADYRVAMGHLSYKPREITFYDPSTDLTTFSNKVFSELNFN